MESPECSPPPDPVWLVDLMTKRELQILFCTTKGVSIRDLAEHLCISQKTVKFHLTNIYQKLGVRNRLDLVVYLYEKGLIPFLGLIVADGPCVRERRALNAQR